MRYKGIALPSKPSEGVVIKGKSLVVPDQTIGLEEILRRFVRHEPLAIGHKGVYGSAGSIDPESDSPFNVDLEKAKAWDLTEKAEFSDLVKEHKQDYEKSERQKAETAKAEAAKVAQADYEKKVRIAAKKLAQKIPSKTGSI